MKTFLTDKIFLSLSSRMVSTKDQERVENSLLRVFDREKVK